MPGPSPRAIDASDRRRLAEIRHEATTRQAELVAARPADPLEAVAWMAGLGELGDADELMNTIQQARDARFEWKEIAEAIGDGHSAPAARRVADRFKFWLRQQSKQRTSST